MELNTQNGASTSTGTISGEPEAGTRYVQYDCDDRGSSNSNHKDAGSRSGRNIKMMYIWVALGSLFFGISQGPVFDNYLFVMSNDKNAMVGVAESVSGLTSLCAAVPVGLMVDRWPHSRTWLCRISCYLGLLTAVGMTLAVLYDSLALIYASLVLLGLFYELSNSVTEAIFADSIPQGSRADIFTTKSIIQSALGSVGPGLTAVGFYLLGDVWGHGDMKKIIIAGNCMLPLASWSLMFFKDPPAAQAQDDDDNSEGSSTLARDTRLNGRRACYVFRPWHVPFILAFSNWISCIGAGMTVKFFNLWWIHDMHFSGADISWVQTVYPLVIAFFMKALKLVAKPLGRAQASLLFFSMTTILFVGLAEFRNVGLLLVIFFVRGAFANCVSPIDRSILMDFTPSSQRGKWNTLESFASTTWSGSAFIGGLISDSHDYRFTFLITGAVYFVAALIYSPLLMLVPRKEDVMQTQSTGQDSLRDVVVTARGCPEVPLQEVGTAAA